MPIGAMISYSKHDLAVALQFRDLLGRSGVRVWMDRTDIVPGSDWQKSIESGIKECEVLVVLFSQASLASREVEAEWSLGLRLGKRILPVLLETVDLPFRLANNQYFSADPNDLGGAAAQLAKVLPKTTEPPTRLVTTSEAFELQEAEPKRYASITLWLEDDEFDDDERRTVIVDRQAFGTVKSLLDRLYLEHLSSNVRPYTYGEEWILSGPWLVVPFQWLTHPRTRLQDLDLTWISRTSLADIGFEAGWCEWNIKSRRGLQTLLDRGIYGVVASNPRLVQALALHPKSTHYLLNCEELFERRDPTMVAANNRPFELVFVASGFKDLSGSVFIETPRAAKEDTLLKKHLRTASHLA